jgi:hypothetical protein
LVKCAVIGLNPIRYIRTFGYNKAKTIVFNTPIYKSKHDVHIIKLYAIGNEIKEVCQYL